MKVHPEIFKRAIAAIASISLMACGINHFAKLGWFGNYDILVLAIGCIIGFFLLGRLGFSQPITRGDESQEKPGAE
jgi:hypothetical protein